MLRRALFDSCVGCAPNRNCPTHGDLIALSGCLANRLSRTPDAGQSDALAERLAAVEADLIAARENALRCASNAVGDSDALARRLAELRAEVTRLTAALADAQAETRRACARELRTLTCWWADGTLVINKVSVDALADRWAPSAPGEDATPPPGGKGE